MENQFCPSCGANLPEGAAFCGNCGAKIAQDTPANKAPVQAEPPAKEPDTAREAAPAASEPVQQPQPAEPEAPAAPPQPSIEQSQANGFAPGQQSGYTAPPNYGAAQPQQPAQTGYGAAPQQPTQAGYGAPQTGGQPPYAPNQAYGQPQGQTPYRGPQTGGQPPYAPNQAPYGQPTQGQPQYGQAYAAPQQPQAARKKMKPLTLVLIILGSLIVLAGIIFLGIKLFGGGSGISLGSGSISSSSPSGLTLDKMFALDPSWTRDDIEETYGEPDSVRTGDFEYYTYDDVKINDEEGFIEVWFDDDDSADFAIWECDVDEDDVDDFVNALISYMDKKYGDHEVDSSSSYHTDYSWENPNIEYGHLEIQVDKEPYDGEVNVVIWNFM